ncbi:MAG: class I SAM-dependent methyltransferase [Halioglobus sp.]
MTDYKYNLHDQKLDNYARGFESRVGDSSGDIEVDFFDSLRLLLEMKRDGAVIDIGAGTGRATVLAQGICREVVALEPDRERWQGTHSDLHDEPQCRVLCQTSSDYIAENPGKKFDVVILGWVVQHISTVTCDAVLRDVAQLLQPDGVAIIATTHTIEEAEGFSCAHADLDEVYMSEVAFNTYAENSANQPKGIPVRRFSKKGFLAALAPLFETIYWRQISYFLPPRAERIAARLKVDPQQLLDIGNSQFVVVRRKSQ